MNLLLLVRESLGLNQETLAGMLGVSMSTYRMAETNRRNLPPEAVARLTWMYNTVQSLPETNGPSYKPEDFKVILHRARKKKVKMDKDLTESATKWKQMQNRIAFQPLFQEQFPPENHVAETSYMAAQVYYAKHFFQTADLESESAKIS
jgi:transcriptional regulator with XRE-family HTH domain